MNNPNEVATIWDNIYDLGKVVAPWGTVGYTLHLIINKVFRYFSDSRDRELAAIVKRETDRIDEEWKTKFRHIEDKIDNLTRIILEKK